MRALILLALLCPLASTAAGKVYTVEYPASTVPGELVYGVTYRLWVPEEVKTIRAVIVHQHGCGEGACKGGLTAADDLHWQALAKKWDAALLGPSYHQPEKADCRAWCDPRRGSEKTFLRALSDFAEQAGHPEIAKAPWCLWGHSGGGFWSSLMMALHPERTAAVWLRSGSAYGAWMKGDVPAPILTDAVYRVPVMVNGGLKEETDKRHGPGREADRAMFLAWREKDAPMSFATDPRTQHECGDSRYLAIPFLDACLALRLPDKGDEPTKLKPVDMKAAWLGLSKDAPAVPAAKFQGDLKQALWLPNEFVAKAWAEYVKTGATEDTTPPPAPTGAKVQLIPGTKDNEITWEAEADFESGIQQFIIERDGAEIGRVPEKPVGQFGRALFQSMSYHDTPKDPLPQMRFVEKDAPVNIKAPVYKVRAINSVGLESK